MFRYTLPTTIYSESHCAKSLVSSNKGIYGPYGRDGLNCFCNTDRAKAIQALGPVQYDTKLARRESRKAKTKKQSLTNVPSSFSEPGRSGHTQKRMKDPAKETRLARNSFYQTDKGVIGVHGAESCVVAKNTLSQPLAKAYIHSMNGPIVNFQVGAWPLRYANDRRQSPMLCLKRIPLSSLFSKLPKVAHARSIQTNF